MSKSYCGIGKVPKGQKRGSMKDCAMSGQIRYYGLKKVDSKIVEYAKKAKKGESKRSTIIEQKAKLKGKINVIKKQYKDEKDPKKKKALNDKYKELVVELKKLNTELGKMSQGRVQSHRGSKKKSRKRSKSRKGSKKTSKKRSRRGSKKTSKKKSRKGSKKRSR